MSLPSTTSAFRLLPVEGKRSLRFQAIAPAQAIHRGALGNGVQVVLHWSRDDALNCMGTMLMLLGQPEFARRDGFEGRETPPCVVPIKLGDEPAPRDAVCRVIVESSFAEPHHGSGILSVELTPERAASLAERLMRRCGLKRVRLVNDDHVAWEDAPGHDSEESVP